MQSKAAANPASSRVYKQLAQTFSPIYPDSPPVRASLHSTIGDMGRLASDSLNHQSIAMLTSVVMTVYNRERYVAAAIESVLAQTFSDFELIIWDDGSNDRSVDIARSYAEKDKRIRLFESEHLGLGRALDAATRQVQGSLMGIVDSDDILMPTALEKTVTVLSNNPHIGMVYTNHSEMDEAGNDLGIGKRCKIPYSKERLLLDFMILHFRLVRTNIFWKVGGIDTRFGAALDYNLCLKLSEITDIQHIPEALYRYRIHRQSISGGKQLEQIRCTYVAISQALQRRGLADSYELKLEIKPWFWIREKPFPPVKSQQLDRQEDSKTPTRVAANHKQ